MVTEATWSALTNHEPGALTLVEREYGALVMAIARGIVRDEWDAEEVLQDVLLAVHYHGDSVRSRVGFEPWLKQVARNSARMLLRRRRRLPTPVSDDVIDAIRDEEPGAGDGSRPEDAIAHGQLLRDVARRLQALPRQHRDLFVAVEIDGEPRSAVMERFGLSTSAFKSRIHRIRNNLREAALAA